MSVCPLPSKFYGKIKIRLFSSAHLGYKKKLFWAAFTLAFFAFLRVSEFTRSVHCLRLCDLTVAGRDVKIFLRFSKADQFRHGCILKLEKRIAPYAQSPLYYGICMDEGRLVRPMLRCFYFTAAQHCHNAHSAAARTTCWAYTRSPPLHSP